MNNNSLMTLCKESISPSQGYNEYSPTFVLSFVFLIAQMQANPFA